MSPIWDSLWGNEGGPSTIFCIRFVGPLSVMRQMGRCFLVGVEEAPCVVPPGVFRLCSYCFLCFDCSGYQGGHSGWQRYVM